MTTLIHVLGADIPHHNETLLRFFNDVMSVKQPCTEKRRFLLVSAKKVSVADFAALDIAVFADKKGLAQEVIRLARRPNQRFFFHGQFNVPLWLAILRGKIKPSQIFWHIWGADLYECSSRLTFRLFYLLRRAAQGQVAHVFATKGDIACYRQRHPKIPTSVLYFPTRLPQSRPSVVKNNEPLTILVGNSGDASNRHLQALREIHQAFGRQTRVVVPMGYPCGNEAMIHRVRTAAEALFAPECITLLTDKLAFEAYLALICRCDAGWFIFERQQGIGTLSLLMWANVPFVLSRKNTFRLDLQAQRVPVLFHDQTINREVINDTRQKLARQDKSRIAFFEPALIGGWQEALALAQGETK